MKQEKVCSNCGNKMEKGQKKCAVCNKKQKNFLMRHKILTFISILVIFSIAGAGETEITNNSSKENVKKDQVETNENKKTTLETNEKSDKNTEISKATNENISDEYKAALKSAENYGKMMNMSKVGIYDQLTSEYGDKFSAEAAQYAVDNVEMNWEENALESGTNYSNTMHMSKVGIYDQLISENGEQFTNEEAQYAIDHMKSNWEENALKSAENYQTTMSMSESEIYDQLISEYGDKFTAAEAQYAVDNL